ncbi:peptidoglycan editing factor PgeF [Consotaella sp. CSK11QG-6]
MADDVVCGETLAGCAGVRHAFFTRRGGVSDGIYRGLNVGFGSRDDPDAVRENRNRAVRFLRADQDLATPWQIHSAEAVIVDRPFGEEWPRADAVVTATPGLPIGVITADCGPVLFADSKAGVVGAAHAGWNGALSGILEATIEAMEHCGAKRENIQSCLGPTITQPSYEVSAERAETFLAVDPTYGRFFAAGQTSDKRQFDLPGLILTRLAAAGVAASFVDRCTYLDESLFFSYRRTTHRGEPDYGRQLSAIILSP